MQIKEDLIIPHTRIGKEKTIRFDISNLIGYGSMNREVSFLKEINSLAIPVNDVF